MNPGKIILIFLISTFAIAAYADEIRLKNGTKRKGLIISASKDHVMIKKGSTISEVAKDQIELLIFSLSDEIVFNSLKRMKCKIINEVDNHLVTVTENGIQYLIPANILSKSYNSSGKIKLKTLPETGSAFKYDTGTEKRDFANQFFFGLAFRSLRTQADTWRETIIYNKTRYKAFAGALIGYNAGIPVLPSIGIETAIESKNDDGAEVMSFFDLTFLYLNFEFPVYQNLFSPIILNPGIHIGLHCTKGDAYTYSFRRLEIDEKTIAVRPRIAVSYLLTGHILISAGISYLYSPEMKLNYPGISDQKISLDFSGVSFSVSVYYSPPLQKWGRSSD